MSPNFRISKFLIFYLLQQLLLNHLRFQYYCTRLHLLPSLHELDSLILHFNDLLIHLIVDINHLFFAKFSLNHLSCPSQISNLNYLSVAFYRSKDCQQSVNMVKKQAPNKDHSQMLDVLRILSAPTISQFIMNIRRPILFHLPSPLLKLSQTLKVQMKWY